MRSRERAAAGARAQPRRHGVALPAARPAPLRERIALLMRGQGIAVDASRILTTSGGTQAIDLICRAFVQPGDTVLVEDPGYFLLFGRLRQAGVRMLPIARRPDGLDLDSSTPPAASTAAPDVRPERAAQPHRSGQQRGQPAPRAAARRAPRRAGRRRRRARPLPRRAGEPPRAVVGLSGVIYYSSCARR
jgi:hypothetical protein